VALADRLALARERARPAEHPHLVLAAGAVGVVAAEYLFQTRGHPYGLHVDPGWLLVEPAIALVALAYAWRAQERLRLVPLLALAAAFHLLWLAVHLHLGVPGDQDTEVYRSEGTALLDGHYPRAEYPPGAVALFALEAWLRPSAVHTANAFVMVPFQLAIVASVWSLRTRLSAWLAAAVALWPMSAYWWEFRFDLAPAAFLVVGLALALRRRWEWAGLALGIGTAVKWSPALAFAALAIWCVAAGLRRAAVRLSLLFATGLLAVYLPFLVWAPGRLGRAYSWQSGRDFTGASIWYLPFHALGLTKPLAESYGTADAPDWTNGVAVAVQIVLVAATLLAATRARRSLSAAVAVAALAPVVFLLTNRIFSPQFLILLLAAWAVAIALVARSVREQAALAALALVATFANAFVAEFVLWNHDRTWLPCSIVLFACSLALTGWLLRRALRDDTRAMQPP
jgi:hypothetical protein